MTFFAHGVIGTTYNWIILSDILNTPNCLCEQPGINSAFFNPSIRFQVSGAGSGYGIFKLIPMLACSLTCSPCSFRHFTWMAQWSEHMFSEIGDWWCALVFWKCKDDHEFSFRCIGWFAQNYRNCKKNQSLCNQNSPIAPFVLLDICCSCRVEFCEIDFHSDGQCFPPLLLFRDGVWAMKTQKPQNPLSRNLLFVVCVVCASHAQHFPYSLLITDATALLHTNSVRPHARIFLGFVCLLSPRHTCYNSNVQKHAEVERLAGTKFKYLKENRSCFMFD